MKDLNKISKIMKDDWDRRIAHDYRFWMSDGFSDDKVMWESGERDLAILTRDISDISQKSFLEVGCGVGRILRAARSKFKHVTGLDVSEKALEKARILLGESPNLNLVLGNGYDMSAIPSGSLDIVASFASLTSAPVDVTANYLCEMHRTLKPGGIARLQFYFGREQELLKTDTLHLRCYKRENFEKAVSEIGFKIEWIEELVLPFQVSFKELGIEAFVISLRREEAFNTVIGDSISKILLPDGEKELGVDASPLVAEKGLELEGWMALKYAEDLVKHGDLEKAKEALRYVETYCRTTSMDVQDLLTRLVHQIEGKDRAQKGASAEIRIKDGSKYLERNLRQLREKFPEVFSLVNDSAQKSAAEVKDTEEGPVIYLKNSCLDHPQKPLAAANAWAKKLLAEPRMQEAQAISVYGFGAGYHMEALAEVTQKKLGVIEPSLDAFQAALSARDLTSIFGRISTLVVGAMVDEQFFDETAELAVRPQAQVTAPEHCLDIKSKFYGKRGLQVLHPKVAVLGPLQGGTLPIGAYCVKALGDLRQRNRYYDMAGFNSCYGMWDQFIFDKVRQMNSQGQFIETLSQLLLDSWNEKPFDILLCMAQAPISIRALREFKNRGVLTVLWFVEDYLRFGYWREIASCFDFVFTIQRGTCIDAIKKAGAGEVHYLPVGCDPMIHGPRNISAQEKARWGSPVSFVGAGYHNRQQTFASLANLPFKIWGTEWPGCRPFDKLVQEEGRRITPEEYVKIFAASDINLNLHSSTERDGVDPYGDFVNPRTFELASAGAFQLVDERSLLPELFVPGKEIITFNSPRDMKEKISYYLAHPEERKKITDAGRARALRDHTYAQRIKEMLSIIYSSKFEELKRRQDGTAWSRMLRRCKAHPELEVRAKAAFERGEESSLDGLVADILNGKGKLTETEQKLMFLFHIRKQIIRMTNEEAGIK